MDVVEQFLATKKVLIVDDLASLRTDLRKILEGMGFRNITEMPDGHDAYINVLEEMKQFSTYDIVFSDINMPKMNGLTLLKHLRALENYKKIPIFIISTETEKDTVINAIMSGASDYIIKPYDEITAVAKIYNCLSKIKD